MLLAAGQPLQHLIFIVQENRSFDSYFGTFPGADGFPYPPPCLPSQRHPTPSETPYPNHEASNRAGPISTNTKRPTSTAARSTAS